MRTTNFTKKTVSVFMITLILMLPMYSSVVFAAPDGLSNVVVTGSNGISGYVTDEADTFTFSARAQITNPDGTLDTIDPEQVRLGGTSPTTGFAFTACSEVGDGSYDCTFSRIMGDFIVCDVSNWGINLWKDDNSLKDSATVGVTCDKLSPTVSLSLANAKLKYGGSENITFNYQITEQACTTCGSNSCSGIKTGISFGATGYSSGPVSIAPVGCSYTGNWKVLGNNFPQGSNTMQINVWDNLNHQSQATVSFNVDKEGPSSIVVNTVTVTDTAGQPIEYFTPRNVRIVFSVNITAPDLDTSTIRADLSNFGLGQGVTPQSTSINGDITTARWTISSYSLSTNTFSKSITVNASDDVGNKKTQTLTISNTLNRDTAPPSIQVKSFTITDTDNNVLDYYERQNALLDLIINITDSGHGLDTTTIVSDFSQLNLTGAVPSKSCFPITNGVTCTWQDVPFYLGDNEFSARIGINASDLSGNKQAVQVSLGHTLSVDSTPPHVELSAFTLLDANGNPLDYYMAQAMSATITVNISDYESGLDPASVYGNFSSIGLSDNLPAFNCQVIAPNVTECSWDSLSVSLDSPEINKIIYITAKDLRDNTIKQQINLAGSITQDPNLPAITGLKITDNLDQPFPNWIRDQSYNIVLYVNITERETGLDTSSIYADLSNLNPTASYENVPKTSCDVLTANLTRCRWDVTLDLNRTGSNLATPLTFHAADNAGQNASVTFTYYFGVDVTGPVSIGLQSEILYNGTSYLRAANNTIIASFTETQSGLDKSTVYLDASTIDLQNNMNPDNCTGSGSTWMCYWRNFDVPGGVSESSYTLKITSATADAVGNLVNGTYSANFIVDLNPPVLESINVTAVQASNQIFRDMIITGNALSIVANLTESTELTAIVNLSAILDVDPTSRTGTVMQGDCTKQGTIHTCTWETSEINKQGYITDYLRFTFTDVVGNELKHNYPIIVIEALNHSFDYWETTVGDSSPAQLDREILTQYDPFMWFPLTFTSIEGLSASQRWPYIDLDTCTGNYSAYISSLYDNKPEIYDFNVKGSSQLPYNIYSKFTFDRADPGVSSMPVTCRFSIVTLVNDRSITAPEYENVTFNVSYYNNPLGTLDERIQKEIDDVKGNWLVSAEWLDTAEKILGYAQMICDIFGKIWQIQAMLAVWKDSASAACYVYPATCPTAEAAAVKSGSTLKAVEEGFGQETLQKYCKLLSCSLCVNSGSPTKSSGCFGASGDNDEGMWSSILSYAATMQGGGGTGMLGNYMNYVDVQHSLILSAISLCIPGVIYNLQKARVIDCIYIECLKSTQYGVPLYLCTEQRSYGMCKFVWGEIFNLVPFASLIGTIGQNILKALSHPYEAIGFGVKLICYYACGQVYTPGCAICYYAEYANMLAEVLCDLGLGDGCEPMWDNLQIDDSVCELALEEEGGE